MLQLQQWVANAVGQTFSKRGFDYFRDGKVELDTCSSHQGRNVNETAEVIRGHIAGSDFTPYSAWASISEGVMTDAHCSCPMGQQGTFTRKLLLPRTLLLLLRSYLPVPFYTTLSHRKASASTSQHYFLRRKPALNTLAPKLTLQHLLRPPTQAPLPLLLANFGTVPSRLRNRPKHHR